VTGYRGHEVHRRALEQQLPAAALLTGPPSVGKWTLTHHLAEHHDIAVVDRFVAPDGLTAALARNVVALSARAPMGTLRLVQIRLDGSTTTALNALLKTLEEPPEHTRFLLTSSAPTLPTVTSRCQIFRFGLLDEQDLTAICRAHGMDAAAAARAARLGRGQVRPALLVDAVDGRRLAVQHLTRALAGKDHEGFDKALRGWDQTSTDMLLTWLGEVITGRWQFFDPGDALGLDQDRRTALRMLTALGRHRHARPRLAIRAALEPFLSQ
jgi:hypothetical protein